MKNRALVIAGAAGVALAFAFVLALAAWPGAALAAPDAQEGQFITVTVRSGDSLAKYARIYGVSGASLVASNQLPDPNLIRPGQIIVIPVARSSTPSLTTPFYYVVQAGDTLNALAARFEMDPSLIATTNGLQNDVIVLGSTLLIPAGPHSHVAVAGETLRIIAALHGTTVQVLANNNPGVPNPDLIFTGQPIFIPIQYNAQPIPLHGASTPVPGATVTNTPVPGATNTPQPGPSATPTTPGSENWIKVTVRSGESLVTYVGRYGVTGGRIRQANPHLADPNLIFPGDVINIPVAMSFTPSRTTPFFYQVKAGETAEAVALKFEMAASTLTAANPGVAFNAGATILVPAGPHLYHVRQGDTLGTIATKYGTTTDFLLTGNTLPNPNAIFLGQLIFIPTQYNKNPLPFD
jgi:LysM repeat protein